MKSPPLSRPGPVVPAPSPHADTARPAPPRERAASPARRTWLDRLAAGLTTLLALAFAVWFAHLSLQRHAALDSNAEDLGFHHQVIWNTAQGRPFAMSLYVDMAVHTDIDPAALHRPDSLLAFHVQPMLLPLSLLYRWWPGAETLLIVQAFGAALAAVPVHRLAARAVRWVWAGPAFAAVYLLAPPLHWALLSDLHTIVLGATALVFLYDFAWDGRRSAPKGVPVTEPSSLGDRPIPVGTAVVAAPPADPAAASGLALASKRPGRDARYDLESAAPSAGESGANRPNWLKTIQTVRAPDRGRPRPVSWQPALRFNPGRALKTDDNRIAATRFKSEQGSGQDVAQAAAGRHPTRALSSWLRRFDVGFWAAGLIALSAREETGLLVAPIALYRAARGPRRVPGLLLTAMSLGWVAVCGLLILPAYGGGPSPFLGRYAHLGATPAALLHTLLTDPAAYIASITRPETLHFLTGLVAMTGGLWLFAPLAIVPALPIVALNVLSAWPWMAAGEAHYSVLVVPTFIAGAIFGAGTLAGWLGSLRLPGPALVTAGALAAAIWWTHTEGLTPLNPTYIPPAPTAHDRLLERFKARIPPAVPVSASSGIYPHLAAREGVYLFPTVRGAEFILLDVTGSAFPTSAAEQARRVRSLLDSGEFHIVDAADGFLLLRRGAGPAELPAAFWTFALPAADRDSPTTDQQSTPTRLTAPPSDRAVPIRLVWWEESNGPRRQVRLAAEWVAGTEPVRWDDVILRAHFPGGSRDLAAESAARWWLPNRPPAPGERFRLDAPPFPAGVVATIEIGLAGGETIVIPLDTPNADILLSSGS